MDKRVRPWILTAKCQPPQYISKNGEYAAVPSWSEKYCVIGGGKQLKWCKDFDSAVSYIRKLTKAKTTGKLDGFFS